MKSTDNPRRANGSLRNKHRQRLKAMNLPCHICKRPIDYSLPYYVIDENGNKCINKWAFVVDEIIPVSRWEEFGYSSARACAESFDNLAPAHFWCNAMKSNRLNYKIKTVKEIQKTSENSGKW